MYPLRVTVETPDGSRQMCIVKDDRHEGGLDLEAELLPVLRECGLEVPVVLAGPEIDPGWPNGGVLLVMSVLPGRPLPFVGADLDELDLTCRLLHEAVRRLHLLTPVIREHDVASLLPQNTLAGELAEIIADGGPWFGVPEYRTAVERVEEVLDAVEGPLVFTNGDYNPMNFLFQDDQLTGWLDFSLSCFQDPFVGLCKFMIWSFDRGWAQGAKCGLVERFLFAEGVSFAQFAPRLCIRCLRMLQREVSVHSSEHNAYRSHVLALLDRALRAL